MRMWLGISEGSVDGWCAGSFNLRLPLLSADQRMFYSNRAQDTSQVLIWTLLPSPAPDGTTPLALVMW